MQECLNLKLEMRDMIEYECLVEEIQRRDLSFLQMPKADLCNTSWY